MADGQYMSQEGLQTLKDELEERKTITRRQISEQIGVAKEQGDLSENFEYQDAKDRQAENEKRIGELEVLISQAIVVEKKTGGSDISIGTSFSVETPDGEEKKFSIVGATETDPLQGKISNESPLGKAFLGKSAGDKVDIELPSGTMTYTVKSID